jgi:hypothetical protein
MMFWTREIAGWILVGFALVLIRIGLSFVVDLEESPRVVEAGVLMLSAMGVLRAGILLIRMSTAARLCRRDASADQ